MELKKLELFQSPIGTQKTERRFFIMKAKKQCFNPLQVHKKLVAIGVFTADVASFNPLQVHKKLLNFNFLGRRGGLFQSPIGTQKTKLSKSDI